MHPLCWVLDGGSSSSSIVGLEEPYTNSALNRGRGSTSFWRRLFGRWRDAWRWRRRGGLSQSGITQGIWIADKISRVSQVASIQGNFIADQLGSANNHPFSGVSLLSKPGYNLGVCRIPSSHLLHFHTFIQHRSLDAPIQAIVARFCGRCARHQVVTSTAASQALTTRR